MFKYTSIDHYAKTNPSSAFNLEEAYNILQLRCAFGQMYSNYNLAIAILQMDGNPALQLPEDDIELGRKIVEFVCIEHVYDSITAHRWVCFSEEDYYRYCEIDEAIANNDHVSLLSEVLQSTRHNGYKVILDLLETQKKQPRDHTGAWIHTSFKTKHPTWIWPDAEPSTLYDDNMGRVLREMAEDLVHGRTEEEARHKQLHAAIRAMHGVDAKHWIFLGM